MNKYSLDTMIASSFLRRAGAVGPLTLSFGVLLVGFFLSWIVGNACASVALLLIMTPLIRACPRSSHYPQMLVSCIAWGGNLGAMATPTSSGQSAAALSLLTGTLGCNVSFGDWVLCSLPSTLMLAAAAWGVLFAYWRPSLPTLPEVGLAGGDTVLRGEGIAVGGASSSNTSPRPPAALSRLPQSLWRPPWSPGPAPRCWSPCLETWA